MQQDLDFIRPARKEAKDARNKANKMIDVACLTVEEIEENQRIEDEKLEQQRLEAGMSKGQRLMRFLCQCNMSKNERLLQSHSIEYDDLPTLNQKDLLDMKLIGMKNMLARRKFLQAIVTEFGQKRVNNEKEEVVLSGSESGEETSSCEDSGGEEERL